jgi:hypothetical protein
VNILESRSKAVSLHAVEALGGERRYSSYSFMTSTLEGGEWVASHPGRAIPPGKGPPVPIVQEAGWTPEPVWTQRLVEKSFYLCQGSNLDRPVVQSVVSQCLRHIPILTVKRAYTFRFLMPWIRQIISFCVIPLKSGIMNRTCTADGIEYKSRQCFGCGYLWKISLCKNEEIK